MTTITHPVYPHHIKHLQTQIALIIVKAGGILILIPSPYNYRFMNNNLLKFLWLLLIPLLAFMQAPLHNNPGPHKKMIKWAVQKTSTLRIVGSSNVNSFGCDINGYYQPDTILCSEENPVSKLVTLKGELEIDILKFDCHNKMLTGDLRKTLRANEYPKFVIRFLSLERTPVINCSKDFLRGWVEIELAGITKRFEVNYSFIKTEEQSAIHLNGNRSFSFTDFKLSPPKKIGGIIKVKNKFNVDFNLLLNPVE